MHVGSNARSAWREFSELSPIDGDQWDSSVATDVFLVTSNNLRMPLICWSDFDRVPPYKGIRGSRWLGWQAFTGCRWKSAVNRDVTATLLEDDKEHIKTGLGCWTTF